MVIYQQWQIKAVTDICRAIFDQKGKYYGYFHQLGLLDLALAFSL